jgi:hypothetical protein
MHKVIEVQAKKDYQISLNFEDGEKKTFDVKPYLDKGIFKELKDQDYFNKVRVFLNSIAWPNGQDFDPDHLYVDGI